MKFILKQHGDAWLLFGYFSAEGSVVGKEADVKYVYADLNLAAQGMSNLAEENGYVPPAPQF